MAKTEGFRFKQFTVRDDKCQMKVGTDGVLLGAWVNTTNARRILDIGTGSGVIALMLAQRTDSISIIDAVEPSDSDAGQAQQNAAHSPWSSRVQVRHTAIQNFESQPGYDLIVSNPPYFSSSQLPPSEPRAAARHTVSLTHDELLQASIRLLEKDGRLAVILPSSEGDLFRKKTLGFGLNVIRSMAFHTRPGRKQERWLFELSRVPHQLEHATLCLYSGNDGNAWSAGYRALVSDFYL